MKRVGRSREGRSPQRVASPALPCRVAVLLAITVVLIACAAVGPAPPVPTASAGYASDDSLLGGQTLPGPVLPQDADGEEESVGDEEPGALPGPTLPGPTLPGTTLPGPTPPPEMKPPPEIPDSLRKKPAETLRVGGAPIETLGVRQNKPTGTPGAATPKKAAPKPPGTPFGLHPVAILAVLVVGHVFLVRAIKD